MNAIDVQWYFSVAGKCRMGVCSGYEVQMPTQRKRHKLMHISIVRRTEVHHGPNGNAYVTTVSAALMKTDAGQRTRLVAVGYGEDISEAVTNMVFEHRLNRLSAQYHSRTKQTEYQLPNWFQERVVAALDAVQDGAPGDQES